MENPSEMEPTVASPRPTDSDSTVPPPPASDLSARGGNDALEGGAPVGPEGGNEEEEEETEEEVVVEHGGESVVTPSTDSSAQGAGMTAGTNIADAVVPPRGAEMVKSGDRGNKERIEAVGEGSEKETVAMGGGSDGLVGSGDQLVAMEVDNSQGKGESVLLEGGESRRGAGVSDEGGECGGKGGGGNGSVPSGEEKVRRESASGAGSSGGAGERRVDRLRRTVPPVRPPVTRSSMRRQSCEPKGKGVAHETPASPHVRVGISLEDYAVHASQDAVMAMARENPGVLAAIQDELRESRKAEMASLRQAALDEEEAQAFAEEFEEEERAAEAALAREEEKRAQGRMTVLQEARRWLRRRPMFDAENYALQAHLFVPSGLDWYISV